MGDIKYNYPVEKLDQLWHMIYDEGITPMMSPDLKAEVELRYYECTHPDVDEDDDEEFLTAVERHNKAVIRAEEEKRKSHSRNIVILDLTEEEEAELADGMSMSYIRSDPNSAYNLSDEDISSDETRRRLYKQLCSLGKVYYHQEDFRNAVSIILEAIEYSLRNDYPWLTYEEAVKQFNEGRIKYTFAQMPLLYIDYNTPISDPKTLAGIVTGEITLIDKDLEPEKPKKKHKAKPVEMPYDVIGDNEHAAWAKVHQQGFDTPISTILKSCSTIYNRYVLPSSFSTPQTSSNIPEEFDWTVEGAGSDYFDLKYGRTKNTMTEVLGVLNEANDRKLNHVIGNAMRDFPASWNYGNDEDRTTRSISTSLEHHDEAVAIESKLMSLIRMTNPNV